MLRRLAGCTSRCVTAGGRSRSLVGLAVLLFAAGGVRRIARCAVSFAMAAVVAGALPGIALADPFSPINPFFGAGLDQKQQQEANRKSPNAKTEREASRTLWIGLSASQSRALGRTTFPEAFTADLFDGERPGPGLKIAQYRGGGVAVAESSTGERLLVQSSAALRAQTPIGQMAPVDLSLRESSHTFSTTNSNVDLRISKNPTAGTELLGRNVTIALQTARESTGTAADGRVFYADVDTDTDYVISPLPDGGEFSWLLRSSNAPERFVLDLKIPQGAKVRRAQTKNPIPGDPPGNLEIVDGAKVLGYIEAPRAYDADHIPVESDLVIIDDDRVAMSVEHHGRDLRYPLLADPEVTVHNDSSRGWTGWRNWYTHGSNWNANTNYYGFALFDPAYNPNGVYLSMPTHTYFWPQGTGINWGYHAPVDSYVYRTILGSIGHSPMPSWYAYGYLFSHIYSGILNPAANNWEAGQSWLSNYGSGAQGIFGPYGYSIGNLQLDHCFEVRCNRAVGSDQNQAVFGLAAINNYNSNNIYTGEEKATGTMGYAMVFLGDRHNPWMRSDAQPPNRDWTDDSASPTHTLPGVTAEDRGLGVYGITLAGGASGNGTLRPSCDGNPNGNYCPKAWTASGFSYQLNEGVNSLSLTPTDIVDNIGAALTWTEKIDRGKPSVTELSGSLHAARNRSDDNRFEGLYNASYALRVRATDAGSGVREIEVYVDGQSQRSRGGYSTSGSLDWELRPDDYSDADHTVKIVLRDALSPPGSTEDGPHVTTAEFEVTVDRRGDIYQADKHVQVAAADPGARVGTQWARIGTHNARIDESDTIVTRTTVTAGDGHEYDEVRHVSDSTRDSETGAPGSAPASGDGESVVIHRGSSPDDPDLEMPSELLIPAMSASLGDPTSSGPLTSVLRPDQHPPPAHGSTYVQYSLSSRWAFEEGAPDQLATTRIWVDSATKMPVKTSVTVDSGELVQAGYFSYRPGRLELSEVASDFFRVARPSKVAVEKEISAQGSDGVGGQTDDDTGATYTPYRFGQTISIASSGTFTFAGSDVIVQRQGPEFAAPDAEADVLAATDQPVVGNERPETTVEAYYQPGGALAPDSPTHTAPLVVTSWALNSAAAQAWLDVYRRAGTAIEADPSDPDFAFGGVVPIAQNLDPRTAYVIALDDGRSSAMVELGGSLVLIEGPLLKSEVTLLVNQLEVL